MYNFQKNKLLSKYEEKIIDAWQCFSQNTISQGFVLNFCFQCYENYNNVFLFTFAEFTTWCDNDLETQLTGTFETITCCWIVSWQDHFEGSNDWNWKYLVRYQDYFRIGMELRIWIAIYHLVSDLCFLIALDCTLIYHVLIFGKEFYCNQGKWSYLYGDFMPVSDISVTEILKDFRGFAQALHLGSWT